MPTGNDIPDGFRIEELKVPRLGERIEGCAASIAQSDVAEWVQRAITISNESQEITYGVGWLPRGADAESTIQAIGGFERCDLSAVDPSVTVRNISLDAPEDAQLVAGFQASFADRTAVWLGAVLDREVVVAIEVWSLSPISATETLDVAVSYLRDAADRSGEMIDHLAGCEATWQLAGEAEFATAVPPFEMCDGYFDWRDDRVEIDRVVPSTTESFEDRATTTTEERCMQNARALRTAVEVYTIETGRVAESQADLIPDVIREELAGFEIDANGLPVAAPGLAQRRWAAGPVEAKT